MGHANWSTLAKLGERLPDGELKTTFTAAVSEVEAEEDEHLAWVAEMKSKMVLLQAGSRTMSAMGAEAEELVEKVRGWFS